MGADGKRPRAELQGRPIQGRFVGVETLESRVFCDHGIAAAIVSADPRSADREVLLAHAGASIGTAQNIGALTQTVSYRQTLTPATLDNYFEFSVAGASTVAISLTGLSGNADLQLIKAANSSATSLQTVATSAHPGTANESIGKKVSAGKFFARVYEAGGDAGYTLTLTVSAAVTKTQPAPASTGGLHIVFNYSYDTTHFFADHPEAQVLLNQAASAFSRFTNQLTAITPGDGNTWSEIFTDPGNPSTQITLNNPSVASNTVVIYVGGSNVMQTGELGDAVPGQWNALGTSLNWINTVAARGQAGTLLGNPTAYAPWGGSISFSDTTNWNLTAGAPAAAQNDFLSVATHEISHILGFGTAPSWSTYVSGTHFVGPHAEALNGGKPIPLAPGLAHWANDTLSTVNGISQYAVMDPYLITGTRRAFTALDYAGLEDVGWTL